MRPACLTILAALATLTLCSCGGTHREGDEHGVTTAGNRSALLAAISTWACQLQGLERAGAIDALAASDYQMLVLEPTRTVQGSEGFDTAAMVERLKTLPNGRRRLVLAYVDIGQAEDYRTYWQADWRAPRRNQPGYPNFLVTVDPDGWEGNYPVAYWAPAWKRIIFRAPDSVLDAVLDDGFDGIYLDWVAGYEEDAVVARARADGVDPAVEMIRFLRQLRYVARQRNNRFLIIAQNAPDLLTGHPELANLLDGISQEDVHFSGESDVAWNNPRAGDIRTPNAQRRWLYRRLDAYRAAGVPVFTIDYALQPANIQEAYALSRAKGYIPFVSRTPLNRLP